MKYCINKLSFTLGICSPFSNFTCHPISIRKIEKAYLQHPVLYKSSEPRCFSFSCPTFLGRAEVPTTQMTSSCTTDPLNQFCMSTLLLFNIAMGNGPFIDGLPIKNCDYPWLCEITRWSQHYATDATWRNTAKDRVQ
jgi:hypothetical protein